MSFLGKKKLDMNALILKLGCNKLVIVTSEMGSIKFPIVCEGSIRVPLKKCLRVNEIIK